MKAAMGTTTLMPPHKRRKKTPVPDLFDNSTEDASLVLEALSPSPTSQLLQWLLHFSTT